MENKRLGSSKNFKILLKNIWLIQNKVLLLHTQIRQRPTTEKGSRGSEREEIIEK